MNALASYPGPYTPSTSTAANPSSRIAQRFFNVISPIDSRIFTPFSCSQLILNHTAHARMIITRSPQFRPSDISVVQNPASLPPKLNIDAYIDIATPNDAALGTSTSDDDQEKCLAHRTPLPLPALHIYMQDLLELFQLRLEQQSEDYDPAVVKAVRYVFELGSVPYPYSDERRHLCDQHREQLAYAIAENISQALAGLSEKLRKRSDRI